MFDFSQNALDIWKAGVNAVQADQLMKSAVQVEETSICFGSECISPADYDRLIIVGAGKATTAMAQELARQLKHSCHSNISVEGWINVPTDCVQKIDNIHVHAARPAGVNEPTEAAVFGTQRILELMGNAGPSDLGICLISGGGSALLSAPAVGISLEEKISLTRFLSENGANISQLNTVRKQISRVKGNRLAHAFSGGKLISLIVSDVIGDELDIIASGPTVPNSSTAADALKILSDFDPDREHVAAGIYAVLEAAQIDHGCSQSIATNVLIGNLKTAVDAAVLHARELTFQTSSSVADTLEPTAEQVGFDLADQLLELISNPPSPDKSSCLISGGEPVVQLVKRSKRGVGGRNQQLALAALVRLIERGIETASTRPFCLFSGGTDGEDGPTDAAGAMITNQTLLAVSKAVSESQIDPTDFLKRNDAYTFFDRVDGLVKTGPTHTNVGDLRVIIA